MSQIPYTRAFTVALNNCRFFARHGVLPQERRAGNEFEVSVKARYAAPSGIEDDLDNTISYADIYEIVKAEMAIPADLLETVASRIAEVCCCRWPQINRLSISITKLTPPIPGFTGSATVELELSR